MTGAGPQEGTNSVAFTFNFDKDEFTSWSQLSGAPDILTTFLFNFTTFFSIPALNCKFFDFAAWTKYYTRLKAKTSILQNFWQFLSQKFGKIAKMGIFGDFGGFLVALKSAAYLAGDKPISQCFSMFLNISKNTERRVSVKKMQVIVLFLFWFWCYGELGKGRENSNCKIFEFCNLLHFHR